jgi:ketosteroid isomerase-like protein
LFNLKTLSTMTQAVLDHHLSAFAVGLDEIMKDYTDESVLIAQDQTVRGLAGIRSFFEDFIAGFTAEAWESFAVTKSEVVGDIAYITWKAPPLASLGTDTFLVRDGKIAVQTLAMSSGS